MHRRVKGSEYQTLCLDIFGTLLYNQIVTLSNQLDGGFPMSTHRHFFQQYFRLYRPFVNELNRRLEVFGLYYAQWSIMYYLDANQSMTLVELSKVLYVEKPTVTRTVNALIKLGYVEQIPASDKREKRIRLSSKGIDVALQIRQLFDDYEMEIMEGVSAEEQASVIRVMETVRDNIIRKGD